LLHFPAVPSPPTIDRDRDRPLITSPNPTPFQPPKPPITMLSGILVFNQKGENLIFRAFRNDCRPRLADVFRIQVISNAQVRSPILTLGSTTFSHVKHENIYLVAITKSNANAALVFEFLYRLIQLGRGYFGKFDEEAVKNNFVLVYELLDGMDVNQLPKFPSRLRVS
jgi:AP-2 complex subunit mu-1